MAGAQGTAGSRLHGRRSGALLKRLDRALLRARDQFAAPELLAEGERTLVEARREHAQARLRELASDVV